MAFSTFSGPLRVGPVREGANRNTGLVILAQSFNSNDLTGRTVGTLNSLAFILPQAAQIVDIFVDQVVASTGGTTTVSVGTSSGGAQLMAAVATTAGGRFVGTTTAATQAAWQTSTVADTAVYISNVTGTGTLTAGQFKVTILYIQRSPSGLFNPVSA
jgi:hypothetical protein